MTIQPARARTHRGIAVATGLLLAAFLGACSAPNSKSTDTRAPDQVVPAPGGVDAGAPGADGSKAQAPVPAPATAPTGGPILPLAAVSRSVVYNGSITIRVADVGRAATSATALATGSGGYVGGDDRQDEGGGSTATIILRVPATQFTTTMTALGGLGTEQSRQASAQDVTGQVADIGARLKTQQASVDRIRALLAEATSIAQIVSIESELTQREADLESLEAQQRSLTDLAALSTITAILLGPEAAVVAVHKSGNGFLSGLKSGWHTFLSSLSVLLTIVGAVLPFLVIIGIPALAILMIMRRRRRGVPMVMATATGAGPGVAIRPGPTANPAGFPGSTTPPPAETPPTGDPA